jgi:hypothetical protein
VQILALQNAQEPFPAKDNTAQAPFSVVASIEKNELFLKRKATNGGGAWQ